MGLVFDRHQAEIFQSWYLSSQGRSIAESLEKILVSLVDPLKGERALDVGCGTGNHLRILHGLGLNITGIDASPYMVKRARERLAHRATLKTAWAEDLPFDDNEFDLSILINSLEFLGNPLQALREAGRVTRKKVFIGVLNGLSWSGLTKRIKGYMGDPLFSHSCLFNMWQLKALLRSAYGDCPASWSFIRVWPGVPEGTWFPGKETLGRISSPFATFTCVAVTMVNIVQTDSIPLKIRLKTAGQSLVGAKTMADLNRIKGVPGNERSIYL